MKKALLLFAIFFIFSCGGKEEEFHPKAIVISVIGDVKSNGRSLSLSEEISDKDVIVTGSSSLCDIQLLESDSLVVIRLKSQSRFKLSGKKYGSTRENYFLLDLGNAIFNVSNVSGNDQIKTRTPSALAGVRGTKYEVNVNSKGNTKIEVLEGEVTAKVRIPELDKFSRSDIKKSKALTALDDSLDDSEIKIRKGNSSEIPGDIGPKILKETGLNEPIKNNKAEEIDGKTDVKKVKESLSGFEEKELKVSTKEIDSKTMDQKSKEYEEITPFEKEKINNKTTRNQIINTRFKKIEAPLIKQLDQWLRSLKF